MSHGSFNTGSASAKRMRGQPVIFLAVVALVWIFGRVIAHLPGMTNSDVQKMSQPYIEAGKTNRTAPVRWFAEQTESQDDQTMAWSFAADMDRARPDSTTAGYTMAKSEKIDVMAAHQLLLLNHFVKGGGTVAPANIASLQPAQRQDLWNRLAASQFIIPAIGYRGKGKVRLNRWSVQGWGYVRGGGTNVLTAGRGQYGGSQIGVIGRYAINPQDGRRLELYLRFAGALPGSRRGGFKDAEFAFGISGRPFKSVPIALAAEQRVGIGSGASNRPAAYAVTQIPPIGLPVGSNGSVYAQTGIVGIKKPQVFFDLQMLAERPVAKSGAVEFSAGAGLWSGGQTGRLPQEKDIVRVDVGPRASATMPIGAGRARLSLDYRARIAGNADPGSGLALTLSSDF